MQRVIVQADSASRMNAEDIINYSVKNSRGQLVPLSAFTSVEWSKGPTQIAGFNYYPAMRINGEARPSPPATPSPRWNGSRTSCRAALAMYGPGGRARERRRGRRGPSRAGLPRLGGA